LINTNLQIILHERKEIIHHIKLLIVIFLFIKQQLKQNKTITMDELLAKLKTKYPNLTLSKVHLGRVVRDINITLKNTITTCSKNKI
jgi:hypothetical protein